MTKKFVVNCKDYNGHKNVLFLMKSDDPRFNSDNYPVVDEVVSKRAKNLVVSAKGGVYKVYSDWSLLKLN